MNYKFILSSLLVGLLLSEGALFIFLTVKFGFLAVIFFYSAKSIIGGTALHYLLNRHHPNPSQRIKIIEVFSGGHSLRHKAIMVALGLAIPGIVTTVIVLLLTLIAPLRNFVVAFVTTKLLQSFMGGLNAQAPFGTPFGAGNPFGGEDFMGLHTTSSSQDAQSSSYSSQEGVVYEDVERVDANSVWQKPEGVKNEKSEEKKEDPVVVDI